MLLVFLLIVFTILCSVDHKYWPLVLLSGLVTIVIFKNFYKEGFASPENIEQTEQSQNTSLDVNVATTQNDIDKYDNNDAIDMLFMSNPPMLDSSIDIEDPETGDDLLYTQSKNVSQKSKEAQDNRIRFTSDNFRQYFKEELDEQENRHWWDNNDKLDQKMYKDEMPEFY
jgi:hypothetical protein